MLKEHMMLINKVEENLFVADEVETPVTPSDMVIEDIENDNKITET